MNIHLPVRVAYFACVTLIPGPHLLAQSNYSFTTIATTGEVHSGVQIGGYMQPGTITNGGIVGFAPAVASGGESVFLWRQGQFIKVVAANDPLPAGGTFGYLLAPMAVNSSGDVAFTGTRELDFPLPLGLDAGTYRGSASSGTIPIVVPKITPAPGAGVFYGASWGTDINSNRNTAFTGMICSTANISAPIQWPCPNAAGSLALGVYVADTAGHINAVAQPGDPAPGGGRFDYAKGPSRNEVGDVAFSGHVFGEDCADIGGAQSFYIFCAESLYLKQARAGAIVSIAHRGDASPAGAHYFGAYGAIVNARGDVAFLAELQDSTLSHVGVFLYRQGTVRVIAKPGDPMPGGGVFATGGGFAHDASLNSRGDVAFVATLGSGEQGLYVWHDGALSFVAKTGTDVPGGVIATLDDYGVGSASSLVSNNDSGQILFAAHIRSKDDMTASLATLLVATPVN